LKTYQDLQECGTDEQSRMDFIRTAIRQHKSSELYKTAIDAMSYYAGENPTISRYEKIIYDMQGRAHRDMYTANHKIKSRFFQMAVDQENSYLLGNGVTFQDAHTKSKLGTKRYSFDHQIQLAGEYALIGGVSFGFWNHDHIDVFSITSFVPLYDEENGALMSAIRFWQVDAAKPLRATLYEPDGYTDYIQRRNADMEILNQKRNYRRKVIHSEVDGIEIYDGQNYPSFPIVPLKNNRECRSEICGRRNTVDALDLARSNMINNVDEGNLIYWVLSNCSGMDDLDDVKFLERLRLTHVAHTDDNGDGSAQITPHTIEAPFAGTSSAIDMLERALYQDFQAFDSSAVSAGNQTATAIKASYVPLDLKTDRFERQVTEFINSILELAGIDDAPGYVRNKIVNAQEEMQTLLMFAEYVDDTYITTKGLTLLGDADMTEDILKRRSAEELGRFAAVDKDVPEDVADEAEAIEAAEEAAGKMLNGSQTSSLITVIKGLKSGDITEGQAVRILTTSIGVTRDEALAIIRGED